MLCKRLGWRNKRVALEKSVLSQSVASEEVGGGPRKRVETVLDWALSRRQMIGGLWEHQTYIWTAMTCLDIFCISRTELAPREILTLASSTWSSHNLFAQTRCHSLQYVCLSLLHAWHNKEFLKWKPKLFTGRVVSCVYTLGLLPGRSSSDTRVQ